MATTVSLTSELQVELLDSTGAYKRTLRIPEPLEDITKADVVNNLGTAIFAHVGASSDTAVVSFYYDNDSYEHPMTQIGEVRTVTIRREETILT